MDYIKGLSPNRADDKEAFLCMSLNSNNSIIKPNYYSGLTIAYLPCDKVNDYFVSEGSYEASKECVNNQTEIRNHLDIDKWEYYQTFLYYNYEYFDADKYDDESIQGFSKISEFYFDPLKPKWFDFDY